MMLNNEMCEIPIDMFHDFPNVSGIFGVSSSTYC